MKMTLDMLKNGETAIIKTVGGEGALRLRFELTLRKADARLIEVEKI